MPRVGGVIITHGQLATELLHAAEMIVGDIRHVRAVSIDWHDDVEMAQGVIERAITEADQGWRAHSHGPVWRYADQPRHGLQRAGTGGNRHRRQPADGHQAGDGAP